MKKIVLILFSTLILSSPVFGWGREGHEVIAKIADRNLKPSVKKKIESYLGHSIVYYAKWMDEYRHTPEYRFTTHWHACTVDKDLNYVQQDNGDAVSALAGVKEVLGDYKNHSDSTVIVNLKYALHLVGDLHCPSHISYLERNFNFKVHFGGGYIKPEVDTNIHMVWDALTIQSSRIWSVSEYAQELDRLSRKEISKIVEGTPEEWLVESAKRCLVQFDLAHPGDTLAQDFVNAALPLIETQMLYAGYRLAHFLNTLF